MYACIILKYIIRHFVSLLLINGVFIVARTSDIIQIAAASGLEEMSIYMRPTTQISNDASAVTGLKGVDGVLKYK